MSHELDDIIPHDIELTAITCELMVSFHQMLALASEAPQERRELIAGLLSLLAKRFDNEGWRLWQESPGKVTAYDRHQ
jgi:hypothetical protein